MRYIFLLLFSTALLSCGDEPKKTSSESVNLTESKEEQIQKGKVLFSVNCKLCHSLNNNAPTGLGPVLDSIPTHWPDTELLAKYIKNAPAMMQSTERSRKVYAQWKDKPQMPPFNGLSKDEINDIIAFLYSQTN